MVITNQYATNGGQRTVKKTLMGTGGQGALYRIWRFPAYCVPEYKKTGKMDQFRPESCDPTTTL